MAEIFSFEPATGYTVQEIRHDRCRARVAHWGAQLLEWTPTGFEPVLYCSRRSIPTGGTPMRGGIPICWPWFADHPEDPAQPLHGFVQSMCWTHSFMETNDEEVRLGFWVEDDEASRSLWPHRFRLEIEMRLGAMLSLQLRMKNIGSSAFSAGGAFHPYFAIDSLAGTMVSGVAGVKYLDKTTSQETRGERGPLVIRDEVDRIYHDTGMIEIQDRALRRRVRIAGAGHRGTVIWNPGREEAGKVEDMAPGDFEHFIAVEPVLPPDSEVLLSPGEEHALTMEIKVEPCGYEAAGGRMQPFS